MDYNLSGLYVRRVDNVLLTSNIVYISSRNARAQLHSLGFNAALLVVGLLRLL